MVNGIILQTELHSETTFPKKHRMIPLKIIDLDKLTTAKKRINALFCFLRKSLRLYIFFCPISMVNTSSTCQRTPSMKSKAEICHKSYLAAREIQIAVSTSARGALTAMLKP